ncbi:MAG: hypothetical protein ABSF15_13980, partial [Candidatus Sulfotelmatobacter sp.]
MPQVSSGTIPLRKFGRADAKISALGFGCHHLGEARDATTASGFSTMHGSITTDSAKSASAKRCEASGIRRS